MRINLGLMVVLGCVMGGVSVGAAPPQATAKQAVEMLAERLGPRVRANVVRISGVRGGDQPAVWRVIARDPSHVGALRDFTIEHGRIVGDQYVPPAYLDQMPQTVIRPDRFQMDSSAAFLIADRAANGAKVGFDSLDYEITQPPGAPGPVWQVTLSDLRGFAVGEVRIRASDGAVLGERWTPQGAPSGPSYPEGGYAESGAVEGTGMGEAVAEGWHRGTDAVKTGVVKAGGSVKGFLENVFDRGNAVAGSGGEPNPNQNAPISPPQQQDTNSYY